MPNDCCGVSICDMASKICDLEECLADLKSTSKPDLPEYCRVIVEDIIDHDFVEEDPEYNICEFGGDFLCTDTLNDVWDAIEDTFSTKNIKRGDHLYMNMFETNPEDGEWVTSDIDLGSNYRTLADIRKEWNLCPG